MKKKLVFVNDIPKQYLEHKEYVKKTICYFFNAFDLVCELKIKFIDSVSANEYEETDCIIKNKSIRKHELLITNSALYTIKHDGGAYFYLSIYHEFEHIRDYNSMMQTKLFNFNLCLACLNNFENAYISAGFLFWTEIYAYYKTFEFAKQNELKFEKITFSNLVNNYIKTVTYNKNLYYKKDLSYDEAMKYINCVNSFVYLCAKFMASVYMNHSRVPYARIEKNKDYKKVYSILCKLAPKVERLMKNQYNQKSYDNLLRLGKYICENIKWKIFKVGLTKKKRTVLSFY